MKQEQMTKRIKQALAKYEERQRRPRKYPIHTREADRQERGRSLENRNNCKGLNHHIDT